MDVIVLSKPGQIRPFLQHYRPISLLSVVRKITEGVVLRELQRALNKGNVLQNRTLYCPSDLSDRGTRPGHVQQTAFDRRDFSERVESFRQSLTPATSIRSVES